IDSTACFFSSRRRHTSFSRDWSSDVCSSDLNLVINNTFTGGTVGLQANSNVRVNGMLTISNGTLAGSTNTITVIGHVSNSAVHRSEERRVGKESRQGWSTEHYQ